jgi:hypothetical protein
MFTASVVQEVAPAKPADVPDSYRLVLTCRTDTRDGAMQLAWSPNTPDANQLMTAAVDGKTATTYKLDSTEKMGNGNAAVTGPGAVILYSTAGNGGAQKLAMGWPAQTLTVRNVFGTETVVFSFDGLSQAARQSLAACFGGTVTAHK